GTMGGTVDTSGSASTRYEVDYIRVYQTDSGNTVLTQRPALSSGTVTLTYGQNTNRVVPILNYPHTLTVSGSIPGLTASVQTSAQPVAGFSGSTGKAELVLSGTPTQSGTFNLTVTAVNSVGSQTLTLPVTITGIPSWTPLNPGFDQSTSGAPTSWSVPPAGNSTVWSNSVSALSNAITVASTNGWIRSQTNATADGYELATNGSVYYGSSTPVVPRTAPASLKVYGGYAVNGGAGTVRMYRVTNATTGTPYQFEAYAHTGAIDGIGGSNVDELLLPQGNLDPVPDPRGHRPIRHRHLARRHGVYPTGQPRLRARRRLRLLGRLCPEDPYPLARHRHQPRLRPCPAAFLRRLG
ncbi:MAG: hypothetical protein EBT68_06995, partial [Verrucomicrobia bacterium]|nr:hypothetical protein [Verrucomicrobiota bacterium]